MRSKEATIQIDGGERRPFSDFLVPSNIQKAREKTASFFEGPARTVNFPQIPFDSKWAYYDEFFRRIATPLTELTKFEEVFRSAKYVRIINCPNGQSHLIELLAVEQNCIVDLEYCPAFKLNYFINELKASVQRVTLTILSFLSLCFYLLFRNRKNKLAIWTQDYLCKNNISDPRLGEYYSKLKANDIYFVEFLRHTFIPLRTNIKNFINRKRPVIYYKAVNELFFAKKSQLKQPSKISNRNELLVHAFEIHRSEALSLRKEILFWGKIFELLKIKKLMPWFLSSRSVSLVWAAKYKKIPSIGIMHGMSQMGSMSHEYMPEYEGPPIGPDKYGVWGSKWLRDFNDYAKIYPKGAVEISGPLRPQKADTSKKKDESEEKLIIIVSEPNSIVEQILPYIEQLLTVSNYRILLKARPAGTDRFVDTISVEAPEVFKKLEVSNETINNVYPSADLVIGSYSTAVIESTFYDCPFLMVNSDRWGDYYDLTKNEDYKKFFVSHPDELLGCVQEILSMENYDGYRQLNQEFFANSDGAEWLLQQTKI